MFNFTTSYIYFVQTNFINTPYAVPVQQAVRYGNEPVRDLVLRFQLET